METDVEDDFVGDEVDFKHIDDETIRNIVFSSVEDAHKFYIEYGRCLGFDVRITHTKVIEEDGQIIKKNREMECVWAGTLPEQVNEEERKRETKQETRSNCPANLRVTESDGNFIVYRFESSHNHELETPETAHRLKCNRRMSGTYKVLLSLFKEAGFRTCKILDYIERVEAGKLPFRKKDAYNYIDKERQHLVRHGDANSALHFLEGMKVLDPDVYYKYEHNEDNSLKYLLWTNGFSKEAYKRFGNGDVLIFDSTYKTNTYNLVLVILSGVDNHLRNCVFAAALLSDETTSSYVWLLRTFIEAMGGGVPVSVLTDQDAAMAATIREVLPEARHRLCCWHLEMNCGKNVKATGFCGAFGQLLKRNLSVEEFEEKWANITEEHGVAGHPWVIETYSKKEQWGEAFFRGHFMGLMRSTSRAESLNAFFKENGKAGFKIIELLQHFHRCLGNMRSTFLQVQEDSERYKPRLKSGPFYSLRKHASSVYTKEVSQKVQKEMLRENELVLDQKCSKDDRKFYYVFKKFDPPSDKRWTVQIDLDKNKFLCTCKMLESDGLPCRHLFAAFSNIPLSIIPSPCIRERWTVQSGKPLRDKFTNVYPAEGPKRSRFTRVYQECVALCDTVSNTERRTLECIDMLRQMNLKFSEEQPVVSDVEDEIDMAGDDVPLQQFNVGDPKKINPRGAPKDKKQKCGYCE